MNLQVELLETYIQGLINLIIQQNISKKVKSYIKDLLKEFLFYFYNSLNSTKNEKIEEKSNFKIFFHNINKLIYEQVEKSLSTRNFDYLLDYLNIYESLIMRNNLLLYDNDVFDRFICVLELLIKHIKLFKKSDDEGENIDEERSYDYHIIRDISNIIVNILSDNISYLKNLNLAKDLTFYNMFLNNERFVMVLKGLIMLNENFDIFYSFDNLITLKDDKSFLNKFKGTIFDCLIKANDFIRSNIYYDKAQNFVIFIQSIFTETVRVIDSMITKGQIEEKYDLDWKKLEFNNYISKLINFLNSCISFKPCEQLFCDYRIE